MLTIILILIIAYLLGSIPFSLLIPRFFSGIDIRKHGSGNVGATNVLRTVGKKEAVMALAGDVLKGVIPVSIALFTLEDTWIAAAAVAVVLGHVFPVFTGFKGGKGVATTLGALVVIVPQGIAVTIAIWILTLSIFRYVSLASMTAAFALPLICVGLKTPFPFTAAATINAVIILSKHFSNLKRLLSGTESKVFK